MGKVIFPTDERLPGRVDLALAGSLVIVAVLSGLFIDAARPDTVAPSAWWQWLLISTPPFLVAFRRINPVAVTILGTIAQAGIWVSNLPEVLLAMVVILYSAAAEGGRQGLQVAVGSSIVLTVITAVGVGVAEDVTLYQLPLIALTCGTAIVLGVRSAGQRRTAGQLAAKVTESRLRGEYERAEAVARERAYIGKELHDIIGHTLTVIAVRAEAADRVGERRPDVAKAAVADIADAARSALSETRQVLAGLRQTGAVELAPPPDLAAIDGLVEELAASGVDVTLTRQNCDQHAPPAMVAGGAYRIVQESLTNALRHGGLNVVITAAVICRPDALELTVCNTVSSAAGTSVTGSDGGSGLAGMAERAEVLGGTFRAGRRPNGDFAVSATLPAAAARSRTSSGSSAG